MADTLLFRGGNTADINSAGTTVVDREIVIDTDTNEIVLGSSKKRLATQGNDVEFQNATFGGDITAGTYNEIRIGRGGGDVSSNTAVGQSTLSVNTSGASNTAFGREALRYNQDGKDNTAVGRDTLKANVSGDGNTAVGNDNLQRNISGDYNTAVGTSCLPNIESGEGNIAIGRAALNTLVTGDNNVAIGRQAGYYIEGSGNTILGARKGSAADATLENTIILQAGFTERARCDSAGDWGFGGTSSAPNIELSNSGAITAKSASFQSSTTSSWFTTGTSLYSANYVWAAKDAGSNTWHSGLQTDGDLYLGNNLGDPNIELKGSNGGITATGDIQAGGDPAAGANVGSKLRSAGILTSCRSDAAYNIFEGYQQGTGLTSSIRAGGSAYFDGTVGVGGASSAPLISLSSSDGSITAAGDLTVGAGGSNNTTGIDVRALGLIKASRPNANDALFVGYQNTGGGNQTSEIFANGDASFDGDITCANNSKGLILKSPDGTSFRLSVANDGTLSASSI